MLNSRVNSSLTIQDGACHNLFLNGVVDKTHQLSLFSLYDWSIITQVCPLNSVVFELLQFKYKQELHPIDRFAIYYISILFIFMEILERDNSVRDAWGHEESQNKNMKPLVIRIPWQFITASPIFISYHGCNSDEVIKMWPDLPLKFPELISAFPIFMKRGITISMTWLTWHKLECRHHGIAKPERICAHTCHQNSLTIDIRFAHIYGIWVTLLITAGVRRSLKINVFICDQTVDAWR